MLGENFLCQAGASLPLPWLSQQGQIIKTTGARRQRDRGGYTEVRQLIVPLQWFTKSSMYFTYKKNKKLDSEEKTGVCNSDGTSLTDHMPIRKNLHRTNLFHDKLDGSCLCDHRKYLMKEAIASRRLPWPDSLRTGFDPALQQLCESCAWKVGKNMEHDDRLVGNLQRYCKVSIGIRCIRQKVTE